MNDGIIRLAVSDREPCGVPRCGRPAMYWCCWPTQGGKSASASYRCAHHGRAFAENRELILPTQEVKL